MRGSRRLQHRDIKPSLAQPQPKLRSIIKRNASNTHSLVESESHAHSPYRGAEQSRNFATQIQLHRGKAFSILLRRLLRLRKTDRASSPRLSRRVANSIHRCHRCGLIGDPLQKRLDFVASQRERRSTHRYRYPQKNGTSTTLPALWPASAQVVQREQIAGQAVINSRFRRHPCQADFRRRFAEAAVCV